MIKLMQKRCGVKSQEVLYTEKIKYIYNLNIWFFHISFRKKFKFKNTLAKILLKIISNTVKIKKIYGLKIN